MSKYMDTPHYRVNRFVAAVRVCTPEAKVISHLAGAFALTVEDLDAVVRDSAFLYTGDVTDEDAAAIGRAFLEKLPKSYCWNHCPTEYVDTLRSVLHDATCPNPQCQDGSVRNTGPDPVDEPCQFCEARYHLLKTEDSPAEGVRSDG